MTKSKKQTFLKVFEKTTGNISEACKKANISRMTFYRWKDHFPKFAEQIWEIKEARIDFTESQLDKAIDRGEPWAIRLKLTTQGKERGYIERKELNADIKPGGLDIQIIEEKE